MKYFSFLMVVCFSLTACHSNTGNNAAYTVPADYSKDSITTYSVAILDNKKDPVCGMPASAGMTDTAHFNGKVIGFCSQECKAEFVKKPAAVKIEYK